jgi:hypothetical protein
MQVAAAAAAAAAGPPLPQPPQLSKLQQPEQQLLPQTQQTQQQGVRARTRKKLAQLLGEGDTQRQQWLLQTMQLLRPNPVAQLVLSQSGALLLLATGEVLSWVRGAGGAARLKPVTFSRAHASDHAVCIVQIAAGEDHYAARSNNISANLFTWGGNGWGQLGLGDTELRAAPVAVTAIGEQVRDVACGRGLTVAQTELGSVYAWGCNSKGQLGLMAPWSAASTASTSASPATLAVSSTACPSAAPSSPSWSPSPQSTPTATAVAGAATAATAAAASAAAATAATSTAASGANPAPPTVRRLVTEPAYSAVPVRVEALERERRVAAAKSSGDPSRAYETLLLSARGEQAVAFTSQWPAAAAISGAAEESDRDELFRLMRDVQKKRSLVTEAELRYKRTMREWTRRGKLLVGEFPSACSSAAEMVDRESLSKAQQVELAAAAAAAVAAAAAALDPAPGPALAEADAEADADAHAEAVGPAIAAPPADGAAAPWLPTSLRARAFSRETERALRGGALVQVSDDSPRDAVADADADAGAVDADAVDTDAVDADAASSSSSSDANRAVPLSRVMRDPWLSELDLRTVAASAQAVRVVSEVAEVERDHGVAVRTLEELGRELEQLKQDRAAALRERGACELEAEATQVAKVKPARRIAAGVGVEADFDCVRAAERALERLRARVCELESRICDCDRSRVALEEKAEEVQCTRKAQQRGLAALELRFHHAEVRATLYQRLRLRRQVRLRDEYATSMHALWRAAIVQVDRVWRDHVLPADVFAVLRAEQEREGGARSPELLIERAVATSNRMLALADELGDRAVAELKERFARLEFKPVVVGRAGGPGQSDGWDADADTGTCAGSASSSAADTRAPAAGASLALSAGAARTLPLPLPRPRPRPDEEGGGGARPAPPPATALLLLTKVQYLAVRGDELVIDSISLELDGQGAVEMDAGLRFQSQNVAGVLYEDQDGAPSRLLPGARSERVRVEGQAGRAVVTLRFPVPVSVMTQNVQRGKGALWVGIHVDSPRAFVRVYGRASRAALAAAAAATAKARPGGGARDDAGAPDPAADAPRRKDCSWLVEVRSDSARGQPPHAIDALPAEQRYASPLHPSLRLDLLSVCDRCRRMLRDAVRERRAINALLLSVSSLASLAAAQGVAEAGRARRVAAREPEAPLDLEAA